MEINEPLVQMEKQTFGCHTGHHNFTSNPQVFTMDGVAILRLTCSACRATTEKPIIGISDMANAREAKRNPTAPSVVQPETQATPQPSFTPPPGYKLVPDTPQQHVQPPAQVQPQTSYRNADDFWASVKESAFNK